MKTLKTIENDLLQAYKSLVVMRSNPNHTPDNIRAIASRIGQVREDLVVVATNHPANCRCMKCS